jgi:hypothetical protein
MKKVGKAIQEQEEQLAKFKAAARECACEESGDMYDALLREVAQLKPMMRRTPKWKLQNDKGVKGSNRS